MLDHGAHSATLGARRGAVGPHEGEAGFGAKPPSEEGYRLLELETGSHRIVVRGIATGVVVKNRFY